MIRLLGAIPRDLRKQLRMIGLENISPSQIQKTVLLGTTHILRKYLMKFLDPRRGSERKRTPKITPVQNIW